MTNGARTNAPYLVVGFCFMLLGILLVLDRLGTVEAEKVLQFWPIGLVLLGGSMMVQAIRGGSDGAGVHRSHFPVGAVIWLVLLGLFFSHTFERRSVAARNTDPEHVSLFALMSGDRRTSVGEHFRGGEMTSIMGGTQLDLCHAKLAPGEEAVVDVFTLMGGAVVHVPEDWMVDVQATSVMGGIKDERPGSAQGQFEGEGGGDRRDNRNERRQSARRCTPPPAQTITDTGEPSPPAVAGDILEKPGTTVGVERDDRNAPPGSAPPRLVLRGFVMMGGLIIRS